MPYYRVAGNIPPKRHTQHRAPDGSLYFEELMGEEGFSSDSSLLYHVNIPSSIAAYRVWELPDQSLVPNHPLTPRHLSTHDLFGEGVPGTDAVTGRRLLLGNADVRLSYVVADTTSPYYRNAIGDECLYVEAYTARVETVFGDLPVGEGDYVVIPRATTYRIVPDGPVRVYAIEANSHITPAKRYLSRFGQLLEHAPFCERDLRGPVDLRVVDERDVEVYIKHRGNGPGGIAGTVHTLPHHPFDVVGWDGCLYPYVFSIRDFEPLTGRVHQPPAGPPGVRGAQLRHLQLRAAQGRLPPPRHPGAVLPLERGLGRGDVLLRRGLRGPQGLGDRAGFDQPAPRRPPARAAARRLRAVRGSGVLRRAGRHGRHLPAAGTR